MKKCYKKKHVCPICEAVILGTNHIKNHLFTHNAIEARFKCELCPMKFYQKCLYTRHVQMHQGILERKYFICNQCSRKYVDKRNLINHLASHNLTLRKRYECTACRESYCEERLLKYHIRKSHFNFSNKEPNYHKKKVNDTWVERVKHTKVCVEITKVNENILKIKRLDGIFKNIDKEKDIEKDGYNAYLTSALAMSIDNQHSKAICAYCNKEMLKKNIISHIRERHLNVRKFHCHNCKRSFKRHYHIVQHICRTNKQNNRKASVA